MIIGKRIREVRNKLDLKGEEFGNLLNVTKVAVSNWENGNRTPDAEMLVKIAELGNVTTDYLLGITDVPDKPDSVIKKEPISPVLEAFIEKVKDFPPELINDINTLVDTFKRNYTLVSTKVNDEDVTYIVDPAKKPNGLTKEEELEAYKMVKELQEIEKNKRK